MEAAKLAAIYQYIFGKAYDNNKDNQIKLQKTVYAMNELNMSCGDFAFMWDEFGPFSSELADTITKIKDIKPENYYRLSYDTRGKDVLDRIRNLFVHIPNGVDYTEVQWIESLMSIHYIQHYILRCNNRDRILNYLLSSKPERLGSQENNLKAYESVQNFT